MTWAYPPHTYSPLMRPQQGLTISAIFFRCHDMTAGLGADGGAADQSGPGFSCVPGPHGLSRELRSETRLFGGVLLQGQFYGLIGRTCASRYGPLNVRAVGIQSTVWSRRFTYQTYTAWPLGSGAQPELRTCSGEIVAEPLHCTTRPAIVRRLW